MKTYHQQTVEVCPDLWLELTFPVEMTLPEVEVWVQDFKRGLARGLMGCGPVAAAAGRALYSNTSDTKERNTGTAKKGAPNA